MLNSDYRGVRVVKYIRCSHEGQVEHGDTLEAQNLILDQFIERNHCVLVDTFVDEALTARKKFTRRKEFVRLLEGVKRHDFDLILFTKLDRWFRNIGDYHQIQKILEANGVQWKAVTENYDTTTTNGRLYVNIRLSVAQDECDRDSDRIKDVFAYKLKNKSYISGNTPYGLKLDEEKHVVIDPDRADVVRFIFSTYESTCSKQRTLLKLNKKFRESRSYSFITRCLSNPLYKGQYRDDPEFCEPLIDPDRFDRIQNLLSKNVRERKTRHYYVFSGLILCGVCGCRYSGLYNQYARADGTTSYYSRYRCRHNRINTCSNKYQVTEKRLEAYLLEHIRPLLRDYVADYEVRAAADAKKDPEEESAKIRKKMKKLYGLYMDDLIERSAYESEYRRFQNQLAELASRPAADPERDLTGVRRLLSEDWESVYKQFDRQEKNVFWKSFIKDIVVYPDGRIEVIFL